MWCSALRVGCIGVHETMSTKGKEKGILIPGKNTQRKKRKASSESPHPSPSPLEKDQPAVKVLTATADKHKQRILSPAAITIPSSKKMAARALSSGMAPAAFEKAVRNRAVVESTSNNGLGKMPGTCTEREHQRFFPRTRSMRR